MGVEFSAVDTPVIRAFMKSDAFGRLIAGPVGSGKTTACIIELFRRAMEQEPAPDGFRYTRYAIVRETLKQLKDTVLKDCRDWLGGLGEWRVSENTFHLNFGDVRSEWVFIPLEDATDQGRLLSMQLTAVWASECIEMNFDILAPVTGRIGRYPRAQWGTPTWCGFIADTNYPTEMTPWHEFMENPPKDWQIFKQPSGLSDEAENLNWLLQNKDTIKLPINDPQRLAAGRRYYERLVETYGENSDWVKRYVYAQYGDDPTGAAVFKETWKTDFHSVPDLNVIPGYPLIIGQDFGRNPWSLICQVDHMGRLLVHEEVPGTNVGLEKHVLQNLRPRLYGNKYLGYRIAIVGDPSGGAKGVVAEESCFDALKRLGLPAFPAVTNDIEPRLRSVEALLGRQVNGGPALVVNRTKCPFLVRAMAGGYRFTKTKQGGLRVVPEKFDKEGFSHVADCLQYVCLIAHGNLAPEIARRLRPRSTKPRERITSAAWT
jgi:hypothetical protein